MKKNKKEDNTMAVITMIGYNPFKLLLMSKEGVDIRELFRP